MSSTRTSMITKQHTRLQTGFTLIEAMVSLVVLSVGMIGIAETWLEKGELRDIEGGAQFQFMGAGRPPDGHIDGSVRAPLVGLPPEVAPFATRLPTTVEEEKRRRQALQMLEAAGDRLRSERAVERVARRERAEHEQADVAPRQPARRQAEAVANG